MTTFPHVRITAEGTLGDSAGNEIWTCSMKVGLRGADESGALLPPLQSDLDDLVNPAAAAWQSMIIGISTGNTGLFSSWVSLTAVKASAVAANGKNDPSTKPALALPVGPARGQADSDSNPTNQRHIPYQVALVVTLRGDLYDRGSAGKGRFYLPVPNYNTDGLLTNGLMSPNSTISFALKAAQLLSDINNNATLTSGRSHHVVNIGDSADLAGTRWQSVTKVSVDNRPDTVRRRSNGIAGQGRQTSQVTQ